MIRRRKTGNAIFLAILLTCSAGAIGFSSWLTSFEGVNSDINITIGDTVFHDAKNIIKTENIKKLAYSQYGFNEDNAVDSKNGNLEFTVVYDFDQIDVSMTSLVVSLSFDYSSFYSNVPSVNVYTNLSNIFKTYNSSSYSITGFNMSSSTGVLDYSFEIYNIKLDPVLGSGKRYISITNRILFNYSGIDFYNDVYTKVSSISNFSITLGIKSYS